MIPAIINTPEPMLKVRLATPKDVIPSLLENVQAAGVMHVEQTTALEPTQKDAIKQDLQLVQEALQAIDEMLNYLAKPQEVEIPENLSPRSLPQILSDVDTVHASFSAILTRYDDITKEIALRQERVKHLGVLASKVDIPLVELTYTGSYLFSNVIVLPLEAHELFLENIEHLLLYYIIGTTAEEAVIYFIVRSRDREAILKEIRDRSGTPFCIEPDEMGLREFVLHNRVKINLLQAEQGQMQHRLQAVIQDNLTPLAGSREALREHQGRLSVMSLLGEARHISVVEGWVPQGSVEKLENQVREPYPFLLLEKTPPEAGDKPPTKLKNSAGTRPFQVIVNLFSIPKYGDWDPTPIVAYFFAFFFGLMLNDVLYAFGLILVARFLLDKLVDDPEAEGVKLLRNALYISATVALILGMLSGIYLGDFFSRFLGIELSRVALAVQVQQLLSDPISFIILALILGMIHVNAAHILSLIRGIQEGNWGMLISKIGLFLIQIFGIPYLLAALLHIELFPLSAETYAALVYPLALGMVLIIGGAFLQMGLLGAIFWIFDLTGFLGDIMSYSRLAGVGLATFYLASSFNLLAQWFSTTISQAIPGIIGSISALIVAVILLFILHVFNILLSSLAAFIHSLRLCFVEFLMKFYAGGGRAYAPFRRTQRRHILMGQTS
jgi:V/A-type H+-transporting ATPase subunit I